MVAFAKADTSLAFGSKHRESSRFGKWIREYAASDEEPANRYTWKAITQHFLHRDEVRARSKHIIKDADRTRRWIYKGTIDLISPKKVIDRRTVLRFVCSRQRRSLDHKFSHVQARSDPSTDLTHPIIVAGSPLALEGGTGISVARSSHLGLMAAASDCAHCAIAWNLYTYSPEAGFFFRFDIILGCWWR
jgi:hypothetical protein